MLSLSKSYHVALVQHDEFCNGLKSKAPGAGNSAVRKDGWHVSPQRGMGQETPWLVTDHLPMRDLFSCLLMSYCQWFAVFVCLWLLWLSTSGVDLWKISKFDMARSAGLILFMICTSLLARYVVIMQLVWHWKKQISWLSIPMLPRCRPCWPNGAWILEDLGNWPSLVHTEHVVPDHHLFAWSLTLTWIRSTAPSSSVENSISSKTWATRDCWRCT